MCHPLNIGVLIVRPRRYRKRLLLEVTIRCLTVFGSRVVVL